MRTVDVASQNATLDEVLTFAEDEDVIVRSLDGRRFLFAEVDDFEDEVAALSQSAEFRRFLEERSKEDGPRYTLEEVCESLGISLDDLKSARAAERAHAGAKASDAA